MAGTLHLIYANVKGKLFLGKFFAGTGSVSYDPQPRCLRERGELVGGDFAPFLQAFSDPMTRGSILEHADTRF